MTKLQIKSLEQIDANIRSTRSDIYGVESRIKNLKNRISAIRSMDVTYRADPNLLELHTMIDALMGDLCPNKLKEASEWIEILND